MMDAYKSEAVLTKEDMILTEQSLASLLATMGGASQRLYAVDIAVRTHSRRYRKLPLYLIKAISLFQCGRVYHARFRLHYRRIRLEVPVCPETVQEQPALGEHFGRYN